MRLNAKYGGGIVIYFGAVNNNDGLFKGFIRCDARNQHAARKKLKKKASRHGSLYGQLFRVDTYHMR